MMAVVNAIPARPKETVKETSEPLLSPASYKVILDFEVGGGESYYNRFLARPTYGGGKYSGPTIGVGYDLGYNSRAVILADWAAVPQPDRARLADSSGLTGEKAVARVKEIRDIMIKWNLGFKVFDEVTVQKFYRIAARTYPGFLDLRPNAQGAIVSLTFNRGSSMTGETRREMRELRALVPDADYSKMAKVVRSMERVWRGGDIYEGMKRRRNAEAALLETP